MIIVSGQDDSLTSSKNVISQFRTFLNNAEGKTFPLVIPIPTTGYAAQDIYNSEEFRNSNVYLTNKEAFEALGSTIEVEDIVTIVINLIKSYKFEKM